MNSLNVGFPLQFDGRGAIASPSPAEHVRQLIELALLTIPGERVNRPQFGSGLIRSIFETVDPAYIATLELETDAMLRSQLSGVIEVTDLRITLVDTRLTVAIDYVAVPQGAASAQFTYDLAG